MITCSPFEDEQDEMGVNQICRDLTPKLLDIRVAVFVLKTIGNINIWISYLLTENAMSLKEYVLSENHFKSLKKDKWNVHYFCVYFDTFVDIEKKRNYEKSLDHYDSWGTSTWT